MLGGRHGRADAAPFTATSPTVIELTDAEHIPGSVRSPLLSGLVIALALGALAATSAYGYLLFHSLVEFFTVAVGVLIGVVAWYTYPLSRNDFLLVLGVGYAGVAVLDLVHTLTYRGMGVLNGFDANLPTQLWLSARYLQALCLLTAPLFLNRRVVPEVALGVVAGLTTALLAMPLLGLFPDAYVEGVGLTPFKIYSEYAIVALMVAAAVHLWRKRHALQPWTLRVLMGALAFTVASELAFTAYISVYGTANLLGHLFKLVSFWLVFLGLIRSTLKEPFSALSLESTTYNAIPVPVVLVDAHGHVRQLNRAALAALPQGRSTHLGRHVHELFHVRPSREDCPVCRCLDRGEGAAELELQTADTRWTSVSLAPVRRGDASAGFVHVSRDITARKGVEIATQRINRALYTISGSNQALLHTDNEHALLQRMCSVAVEHGGYRMACVLFPADTQAPDIRVAAAVGRGQELLDEPSFIRRPPALAALTREAGPLVLSDLRAREVPGWAEQARRHGLGAAIALPLQVYGQAAFGALLLFTAEPQAFEPEEVRILEELSGDLAFGIDRMRTRTARDRAESYALEQLSRLSRGMEQAVEALAALSELRDPYTAGHQRRVAALAEAIAQRMGLPEEQVKGIHMGASIHDVGKVAVPADILNRPGRLTPLEFSLIKTHVQAGYDALKGIEFPWPVAEMVYQHHERLDGSGYPRGLSGGQIIVEARIIAVADVVEAMSSHRPYRPARGTTPALEEIEAGAGTRYDPRVARTCLALFREEGWRFPEHTAPIGAARPAVPTSGN